MCEGPWNIASLGHILILWTWLQIL